MVTESHICTACQGIYDGPRSARGTCPRCESGGNEKPIAPSSNTVTPTKIRLAVEWLAANANGVSLLDWEPRSQTLLTAADQIEAMAAVGIRQEREIERLQRELRLAESARDYANDLLDRARQRSAVETNGWQPFETMPPNMIALTYHLAVDGLPLIQIARRENCVGVTHWMPLPTIPAVEPTPAPLADRLAILGYAPGGYSINCMDCKEVCNGCDKRALRCHRCALARDAVKAPGDRCKHGNEAAHCGRCLDSM